MATHKKRKSGSKGSQQTFASRRTANAKPPQSQQQREAGGKFSDQDAARRLGGYETQGEHARTGNRGRQ
jgi:hypothetical protein